MPRILLNFCSITLSAGNSCQVAEISRSPVVKIVDNLIINGIEERASDIHLEIYKDEVRTRQRIDGVLEQRKPPDAEFYREIVSRIKIMANLDIAERRLPQDGKILFEYKKRAIDIRV